MAAHVRARVAIEARRTPPTAPNCANRAELRDTPVWRTHRFDRYSASAKAIANHAELLRLTALVFGRRSTVASTINFMYGSRQALHQDTGVFHIYPPNFLIGAWIAYEDIQASSGPLIYYPKSHRAPMFPKFDNYPQTNLRTLPKDSVQEYYDYVSGVSRDYERHECLA